MKHATLGLALAAALPCTAALADETYNPAITPADFSTTIDNPLFTLPPGKLMVYEGKSSEGRERVEIRIRKDTRMIMGVETLVYNDRVFLDNQLIEETNDYLAQDRQGNVWYFGEAVDNYVKGNFKDHKGSWIGGENGALPGIWIKGKQVVGDRYRMELLKGEAEDMAEVVATDVTVKVAAGTFDNCTKVYEFTPLEANAKEHKYYCPGVGGQVLSEHLVEKDRVELVKFSKD